MISMREDQRDIQRKLRVLEHADASSNVRKTCRYFGIGRASFYRWQAAYRRLGEDKVSRRRHSIKGLQYRVSSRLPGNSGDDGEVSATPSSR
jgi:transposase